MLSSVIHRNRRFPSAVLNHLAKAALVVSVISCGACASSVRSFQYNSATARDGVVYSLPVTDLNIAATYQLHCDDGNKEARLEMTDLTVTPAISPDTDPERRFVIDPRYLSNALSSVNPAKFELRNGMLRTVTFQPRNELPGIITEVARFAGSVMAFSAGSEPMVCTDAFRTGPWKEVADATTAVGEAQRVLRAADVRMQRSPSEDNMRAVTHAQERLQGARAAVEAARSRHLRRTVEFRYRPISPLPGPASGSGQQQACIIHAEAHRLTPLAPLFAAMRVRSANGDDELSADQKDALTCLAYSTDAREESGTGSAALPDSAGFPGVYYRRGIAGSVWLVHLHSSYTERFDNVTFMHLGPVARVRVENGILENRGFNLAFADDGQLVSYETTSASIARDLINSAATATQTAATAENAALASEIDRLTKERQLIEAREALREAQETEEASESQPE